LLLFALFGFAIYLRDLSLSHTHTRTCLSVSQSTSLSLSFSALLNIHESCNRPPLVLFLVSSSFSFTAVHRA
jgi:hypothetical protein